MSEELKPRNLNPITCAICEEFSMDLYLNTHNGSDRFICGYCLDEIMEIREDDENDNGDFESGRREIKL